MVSTTNRHQPPYPINENAENPVEVLQIPLHVEDLGRLSVAAPSVRPALVSEGDPLLASGDVAPHDLFTRPDEHKKQ